MSAASKTPGTILGGEPRADLLPPEVHAQASARRTRRLLGVLVVLAVVVAAVAVGFASFQSASAQSALDKANATTAQLVQARAKYATTSSVVTQLAATQQALKENASTEVLWGDLYKDVENLLPSGAAITGGDFKTRQVTDPTFLPSGPLSAVAPVASMSISVTGATVEQATGLLSSLNKVPGYADATMDSLTQTNGPYVAVFTLDLNQSALSGRFQSAATGTTP
jgi:type II secretory pathway pseudopilin PulG